MPFSNSVESAYVVWEYENFAGGFASTVGGYEFGRQPDVAAVGRLTGQEVLSMEVLRHGAHFILFNLDAEALRVACDSLLRDCPDLEVLSIGSEGRVLLCCELRPQVFQLGEASMDRILDLMRGPMRERTRQ